MTVKKWVTFIVGFLSFFAVALMILIIVAGNKPYSEVEQHAIDQVEEANYLASIEQVYVYAHKTEMVTVIGRDAAGVLKAVFVPTDEGEVKFTSLERAISPKEAREIATEGMEVKDILHTKLGMDDDGAVWEVTFLNEDGGLNYVYIPVESGTWSRRILNL